MDNRMVVLDSLWYYWQFLLSKLLQLPCSHSKSSLNFILSLSSTPTDPASEPDITFLPSVSLSITSGLSSPLIGVVSSAVLEFFVVIFSDSSGVRLLLVDWSEGELPLGLSCSWTLWAKTFHFCNDFLLTQNPVLERIRIRTRRIVNVLLKRYTSTSLDQDVLARALLQV